MWGTLGLTGLSRPPLGAPTAVPMERAVRNYPQEGFGHLLVGRLKSQPSAWPGVYPSAHLNGLRVCLRLSTLVALTWTPLHTGFCDLMPFGHTLLSILYFLPQPKAKLKKKAGFAYKWKQKVVNTDTGWKPEPSHQGKGPVLLLGEGSQGRSTEHSLWSQSTTGFPERGQEPLLAKSVGKVMNES